MSRMKWNLTFLLLVHVLFTSAQTRYKGLTPNDHELLVNPVVYDVHGVIPTCDCLKKKDDKWYWRDESKPYVGNCIVLADRHLKDSIVYFSRKKTHFNHVVINRIDYLFVDNDFFFKRVVEGDTVMIPCDSTDFEVYSSYRDGKRYGDRIYLDNGFRTKWEYYDDGELKFYRKYYSVQKLPEEPAIQREEVDLKKEVPLKKEVAGVPEPVEPFSVQLSPYWLQSGKGNYVLPCCDCLINKNGAWFENNSEVPFTGQCSVIRDWKIKEPVKISVKSSSYNTTSPYFPKGELIFVRHDITPWQIQLITPSLARLARDGYDALGHPTSTSAPNLEDEKLQLISSYWNGVRHGERIVYTKGKASRVEIYYHGQLVTETVFVDPEWNGSSRGYH